MKCSAKSIYLAIKHFEKNYNQDKSTAKGKKKKETQPYKSTIYLNKNTASDA